jgi:hypothetical protein
MISYRIRKLSEETGIISPLEVWTDESGNPFYDALATISGSDKIHVARFYWQTPNGDLNGIIPHLELDHVINIILGNQKALGLKIIPAYGVPPDFKTTTHKTTIRKWGRKYTYDSYEIEIPDQHTLKKLFLSEEGQELTGIPRRYIDAIMLTQTSPTQQRWRLVREIERQYYNIMAVPEIVNDGTTLVLFHEEDEGHSLAFYSRHLSHLENIVKRTP